MSAPGPAAAQTILGRVVDAATGQPLAGAFVRLEDEAGIRGPGALAGADGDFFLRAAAPGQYRLITELIGYETTRTEMFSLAAGESVRRTVEVPVRAITLQGIVATTDERCVPRPGSGPATARLWEEARKALEIASWSSTAPVRFDVLRYRRELDPASLRVVEQSERRSRSWYRKGPYVSLPAEELARDGYVQPADDGRFDYYAPDADVLLSRSFLDSHCFRVAPPPSDGHGLIGLAFEPVRGRDLPDVEGVLWLDRGTAELRRLDFTYTNLPIAGGREWPGVGGRVEFERLATGIWVVDRWRVRMPRLAVLRGVGAEPGPERFRLAALDEVGADVLAVIGDDGRVLAENAGATLYGTVTNTTTGRPLEGAVVEVVGTDRTGTAGPDGAYRITGLPGGVYGVRFSHPELDAIGLEPSQRTVELEPARATRLALAVATSAEVAAELCAAAGWTGGSDAAPVLLYGAVRTSAGAAAAEAVVTFSGGSDATRGQVLADSAGTYRVCLEAAEAPVLVQASRPGDVLARVAAGGGRELTLTKGGVVRADLVLAGPAVATPGEGDSAAPWSDRLLGTVVAGPAASPVAGATVTLADSAGSVITTVVTNEEGRFTIRHPRRGDRYQLRVEHIGYATADGGLVFRPHEQVEVDVPLTVRAIEMAPIVVRERRQRFLAAMGFYDRQRKGAGLFIERSEIERRHPSRVTDLLQGKPGVRVVQLGPFEADIRLVAPVRAAGDCAPRIIVDDVVIRQGGPSSGSLMRSLDQIVPVEAIEAIEVYRHPSEFPVRYGGLNASCGIVVIWTRR